MSMRLGIGIGLGLSGRVASAAPAWEAIRQSLFVNSEQGGLYQVHPDYCRQGNTEGSTAAAVDSVVGWMQDLSGNNNHAVQSTTSRKPILRSDGTLYWLEFDGVDDAMISTDDVNYAAASFWSLATEIDDASNKPRLVGTNGIFQIRKNSDGSLDFAFNNFTASSGRIASVASDLPPKKAVLTFFRDSDANKATAREDGIEKASTTHDQTSGTHKVAMSAGGLTFESSVTDQNVFGLVFRNALTSDEDLLAVETYLLSLQGRAP